MVAGYNVSASLLNGLWFSTTPPGCVAGKHQEGTARRPSHRVHSRAVGHDHQMGGDPLEIRPIFLLHHNMVDVLTK